MLAAKVQTGDKRVANRGNGSRPVPRIVPTQDHIRALVGVWHLEGETIRLIEERNSGVLLALNNRGEHVNPLRVITRGTKVEDTQGS